MKNKFEYIAFVSFSFIFRILGLNLSRRVVAPLLASIFFYLIPIRKKVVLENLHIAFPENDFDSNNKLAFKIYLSFAITLVEIMSLSFLDISRLLEAVDCSNPELIVDKFNEGKGVILLSSHFGNWEFGAISVALQTELPFSVVVKPLRNPLVFKWMNKGRTKFGRKENSCDGC
jgi:KDO2-lipid IV(A) lauroyltransferase